MATGQETTNFDWQNNFTAHLTADITASSTDIFLDSIPTPSEGILVIDPDTPANFEVIFYNSKTASKVTCPSAALGRGYDGSTAASHLTGTKVIMAPVGDMFRYLRTVASANATYVAAGGGYDFVASGAVITADAAGTTLLATMTAGTGYISGAPVTIPVSTSRAYTASSDTYVDVTSAGALVFTAVANNAASPSLAAGSMRLGIVVTGATNIAAAASINQGQEDRVLPIASSIPYAVTDSLGNLICPRDPNRRVLGFRQITSNFTTTNTGDTQITGFSVPILVPTGRKVNITFWANQVSNATGVPVQGIWDGAVGGTRLSRFVVLQNANGTHGNGRALRTLSAGAHTINASTNAQGGGTTTIEANSLYPAFVLVELV